jgi:glucan phosphoethanolaminetransferase (alkaline phosphatase superfamily)
VTRISVPCVFTRSRPDDIGRELLEFSFISVFRKAGFFTAWISNQGQLGTHNTPVSVIADEAEKVIYQNTTGNTDGGLTVIDEELFPRMRELLTTGPGNRLIVLHLLGSHWRYEYHYPDAFRRFTPVCRGKNPASCPRGELVNSYDNSILYTDHVIGEVIRMVRDRDALVFYVSDHGESLGEEGRYLHSPGSKAPEQYHAAMFVWASESYRRARPDRYRNLVNNRNRSLDHGIIFPSVLDGAGIRTPLADLSKSIFSPMK